MLIYLLYYNFKYLVSKLMLNSSFLLKDLRDFEECNNSTLKSGND